MKYNTLTNDELIELAKSNETNIETLENEIQRLKKDNRELEESNELLNIKNIEYYQISVQQKDEIESLNKNIQSLMEENENQLKESTKSIKELIEKIKEYKGFKRRCIELEERNNILENMIKGAIS